MGRNSLRTCFWAIDCICWNMILSSSFPRTVESNEKLLGGTIVDSRVLWFMDRRCNSVNGICLCLCENEKVYVGLLIILS